MQDQYVSLNPNNTATEERAIRSNLYAQRLLESQGGAAAPIFGYQLGLTAGVLTYSTLSQGGFKFLPFAPAKIPGYSKILAAFLGFYTIGHSYVAAQFGDRQHFKYLYFNRGAIISGSKSWEKQE